MNSSAIHRFREKLRADESVYGLWITLEAIAVTDIAAGLGLDWVVIDADYGHLDWATILEHVRATNRSNTLALIRLSEARPELIQRALSIGADGVVISNIETATQLKTAVESARYESAGTHVRWPTGSDLCHARPVGEVLERSFIIPLIETVHGLRNLDDLLQVDGVNVFFFHPLNDSGEMQFKTKAAAVSFPCVSILEDIRKKGKHAGIVAVSDESLTGYRDYGFRMLGLGVDGGIIRDGIRGALDVTRKTKSHKQILPSAPQHAGGLQPAAGCKERRD